MDRKEQYKHKVDDVAAIRDRNRKEDVALRKEKKDKLLNSKRFRIGEGEEITDEITIEEVRHATVNLQKPGPHRKENLTTLRQAFSQGTVYIDAFFSVENAIHTLVGIFTGTDLDLQVEAAWCITNISAGTHKHALTVAQVVAPYLVTYLTSSIFPLQDQSAWALGNIAGDSLECRKLIQAQGVVVPLVGLLQSPHPSVVQSAAFALSNLARESTDIAREMMLANVIQFLQPHLVYSTENKDVLSEVLWVYTYLSTWFVLLYIGECAEQIVRQGVFRQLVDMLIGLSELVTPLLRCLGNICSGPDEYTADACQNPRLNDVITIYLTSSHRHVRKETLWVTVEPNMCHAVVSNVPLLSAITEQLQAAFDIKMEALYVLCNLACHGEEVCCHLVANGVLRKVVPVLKSSDVELLNLGLSLCEMLLRMTQDGRDLFEECGGIGNLEGLEYHNNETIRKHASDLLDHYFYMENEEQ
ncbi:hypothetical protein KUTeg_009509, partial [Tegillarca granosa]